jgi:hypothetical protein
LSLPGSRLVWEEGFDEGQQHGHDGWDTSAMIHRRWSVATAPEDVLRWYRRELVGLGWTYGCRDQTRVMESYVREDEAQRDVLHVIVRGRAVDRPFWMWWPPGTDDDPNLHYEVQFSATSRSG